MTIRALVDRLVTEYRDSVGVRADDLSDQLERERIAYDCNMPDDDITEAWAIAYALDGIAVQHSHHHGDRQDKAIVRECLRRLKAMGETSSLDM